MTYREFAPPSALANILECVWTNSASAHDSDAEVSNVRTILPDGAMDVITTFFPDGAIAETFAVGSMTRPQFPAVERKEFVGIRFLPGVGGSALRLNATLLTDGQIDMREIGGHSTRINDAFRALRLNPASSRAIHLFADSLDMNAYDVPPLVRQAANKLSRNFASSRISQVANDLRVSRQHLTRIFSTHSGLTPKVFAQICRVRAVLSVAQVRRASNEKLRSTAEVLKRGGNRRIASQHTANASDSWSQLSAEFGYVDQSHLIAEVQSIIGQTPEAWYATGSNFPIAPVAVAPL